MRASLVLVWPSFLVACVLEVLVFAVVDPLSLHWLGQPIEVSRQAVYTLAFFVFWGATMTACGLTLYLLTPPDQVNTGRTSS
jgi:hypothetical protein